jgi:uncharacterized protein YjbI with pentapeptide repeats
MTNQPLIVDWPTCNKRGCIGIRLPRGGKCLAHATARRRTVVLRQLHQTGEIDARGVPITEALLEQILAAAPHDTGNHSTFVRAWFSGATIQDGAGFGDATFHDAVFSWTIFQGNAGFRGATFQGRSSFGEATFWGDARFEGATFQRDAWFVGATFHRVAQFTGATFHGNARFRATFHSLARFEGATFQRDAWFVRATFHYPAQFTGATFHGVAGFDKATFQRGVWFGEATFGGVAEFDGAIVRHDAWFGKATFRGVAGFGGAIIRCDAGFIEANFEQTRQLGPLLVYGLLFLDAAHFAQLSLIEISSRGLSCQRARFPAGVQLRLHGAQVVLDDADLPSPSLLTGVATLSDARLARREQRLVQAVRRLVPAAAEERSEWPRLLSVQGANLAGLSLANIDLAQCRFAGAHNLDKLRFETEVSFAAAPAWLPWDWRQVLAEERIWRAARSNRWTPPDSPPAWLHEEPYGIKWPGRDEIEPAQLAGLYRALRKAREDAKDEPGAADFYYGEMEMRRHARRGRTGGASRGRVERAVLIAYWLVSGYGLRAWRALAALAVVLVAFAGLLVWVGGYPPAASSPGARPASTPTTGRVPSPSTAAPAPSPIRPAPATTAPTSTATGGSTAPLLNRLIAALLYEARTIIGLNPTPAPVLTRWGEVFLIAVRLLGPLLLALAVLALRGRVKR